MLSEWVKEDDRQFKALTGLTFAAFCQLLPLFAESYAEAVMENYEQHQATRKRKPGAGRKGQLDTMFKKLFFILYYLKVYPTFDVLGYHFGLDRSKACTNVHKLLSILLQALDKANVLPQRRFETVAELQAAFAGVEDLLIDATERAHCRPKDAAEQRKKYSGKKKRHTVKNTVLSTTCQMILFLGYTVFGSCHDYHLFKSEFPPDTNWFEMFKLWVDLGYLGIETDYQAIEIHIPRKKPRKSKANPTPTLTDEQKAENGEMSRIRIAVENAICRMKRFRAVTDIFRNRKDNLVDDVALAAAALANWSLSQASVALA
jgi:hypothetical protein